MPSTTKRSLFFLKCPSHNLKAIETFLNKRNFVIHVETEIKEALAKAIELQPEFIFVAWDHEDPRIQAMPKLLGQACSGQVVPYIMSNSREANRKLTMCPINPKLYPPVSGPAIERLVLKSNKQGSDTVAVRSSTNTAAEKDDLITIKSKVMANLDSGASENEFSSEESTRQQQQQRILRQQSISQRNSVIQQSTKSTLRQETATHLKNSFHEKFQAPLENLLKTLAESESSEAPPTNADTAAASGVIIQQGLSNPQGLGTTIEHGIKSASQTSAIDESTTKTSESVVEESGMSPIAPQTNFFPSETNRSEGMKIRTADSKKRVYGAAVYSESWCGYVLFYTSIALEFSSLDLILTDWVGSQMNGMQEMDEKDFFEIGAVSADKITQLMTSAEYTQQTSLDDHNLDIGFFTVDPSKMLIELNDERDLIKLTTEQIPADAELGFSLHLHLPENKKYLLYTQVGRALSENQKSRLLSNRVVALYTPLEFEREYKIFLAEKTVKELCDGLEKKLGTP